MGLCVPQHIRQMVRGSLAVDVLIHIAEYDRIGIESEMVEAGVHLSLLIVELNMRVREGSWPCEIHHSDVSTTDHLRKGLFESRNGCRLVEHDHAHILHTMEGYECPQLGNRIIV